jgi:hypothetical protein
MRVQTHHPRLQNVFEEIPVPAFLVNSKNFKEPFNREGLPRRYLALLIPLLGGGYTGRADMLRSARYEDVNRGYLSDTFAAFSKVGILKFDRVTGVWSQGPNFREYVSWIFMKAMQNEMLRGRWARTLRLGLEDKTVDYILDLEEEDQGRKSK